MNNGPRSRWSGRAAIGALVCLAGLAGSALGDGPALIAGHSPGEALRLGERMYREGLLPSGSPMTAVVQGDIPVDGSMFTCQSCHLRSGLGSLEGQVITTPINARELFRPIGYAPEWAAPSLHKFPRDLKDLWVRPAYTDETLAQAVWMGTHASGREMDWTMPRYDLPAPDMEILIHYLKHLNADFSPGVSEETVTFATVVAAGAEPGARAAMLGALGAYFDSHNAQSRGEEVRKRSDNFLMKEMVYFYRRWNLAVWEVSGPPSGWAAQLDAHYKKSPVFALVGGLVAGSWRPVHDWCERMQVPCVYPVTDDPVISGTDWYTLYYSKGPYQEGQAAARYLRGTCADPARTVVQVFRTGGAPERIARGFRETRAELGCPPAVEIAMAPSQKIGRAFWEELAEAHPGAAVAAWVGPEDLSTAGELWEVETNAPRPLILSHPLIESDPGVVPERARGGALLTYPGILPQDGTMRLKAVEQWCKVRKVPYTHPEILARMYYAGWFLSDVFMCLKNDYYRDYLLDAADMLKDQTYAIALYPRLSYGQGQRYSSKGCYLVALGPGPKPELIPKTDWVIH